MEISASSSDLQDAGCINRTMWYYTSIESEDSYLNIPLRGGVLDKIGPYGSIHGRTHRVRPGKPVSGSIGTNADSRSFVQLLIVSEIDRFENLQAVFQEICQGFLCAVSA